MSVSNELALGFQTTGLGLLVVFVALALIIVIITILGAVLKGKKKKKPAIEKLVEHIEQPSVPQAQPFTQDGELLAVLTAAVTAYIGNSGGANGLVVRSYRRVSVDSPWARAGRNAQIYNKF